MTEATVLELGQKTIETALLVSAPMLIAGLVIGVAISLFQAVTSIQDMTLTFVPKIVAVFLAILLFFPWILNILMTFTANILTNMPMLIE